MKDRILRVKGTTFAARWGYLRRIDVVNNTPVTGARSKALRLSAEMAETIRFNLTARGYRVEVVNV
jgi:hypothetical protein